MATQGGNSSACANRPTPRSRNARLNDGSRARNCYRRDFAMMTREDRQEALSLAYIHAVAAMCGMTHSTRSKDYGLDLTLYEVGQSHNQFVESGLSIEVQVKSTTNVVQTRKSIGFDLAVRAYNLMRFETSQIRLLAVMVLPHNDADWIRQTHKKLELRHSMYWMSLRGFPAVPNRSTIRVVIPKRQLFTPDALREIMKRSQE